MKNKSPHDEARLAELETQVRKFTEERNKTQEDFANMNVTMELNTMQAAKLPRFDWRTIVESGADQLSPEDTAALDKYFRQFVQINFSEGTERRCPCCNSSFGKDGIVGWLMAGAEGHATLEWGIAHGEAFCGKCRYPFRVYHRNVGPIKFLSVGLPYHPDELTLIEPGREG